MIEENSRIALLLGGNKLNAGVLARYHERGIEVVVVDWNAHPQILGDLHLQIDVKNADAIIKVLKEKGLLKNIITGFTSIDVAVPSLAKILETCGMQVNSQEGLRNCFSKSRQTKIWDAAGLLNRDSRQYSSWNCEIVDWNAAMELIVKPDNAASSRGITILPKAESKDVIKKAFEVAKMNASNGIVVIEEFVDGVEYTVEMLGDGFGNVSVYAISRKQHTTNAHRNKVAVKLHYNCEEDSLLDRISDVAIKCYRALGFCNSMGHLEVLLKSDGTISPVEIGARSSGFIASHLVDVASGKSFLGDLEKVQHGAKVENGRVPCSHESSVYFFYDIPDGSIIRNACTLMSFCPVNVKSMFSDTTGLIAGRKINAIHSDNERIGYEILRGPKDVLTPDALRVFENSFLDKLLDR